MEVRISKIEKEVALITQSLGSIAATLERISNVQTDTKLLEEKFLHLDKELQESFDRVHKRLDKREAMDTWLIRVVFGGLIMALTTYIVKGGLVV